MTTTTLDIHPRKSRGRLSVSNAGWWFAFFLIIYIIVLVKIGTGSYLNDNFFFRIYSVAIVGYIFSRFIFAYFHRRLPVDESYEPTITFVVPAKNEEDNIAKTLTRFAEVDYPKEKIEVV